MKLVLLMSIFSSTFCKKVTMICNEVLVGKGGFLLKRDERYPERLVFH